ncbi:MAG: lipopolysaccharide biosynthesis protein [Chromatiales bacterium]|nr:lipopolysaccharide biosynthesis protein [Chromatiales bacterium]
MALSFAQRNSTLIIQFISSLIIVRLLTPHEIGIFSIGSVIVSFTHVVRDLGVSNYLIQERELTPDRIRAAQSILILTSWGMALLIFLLAEPLAVFYTEPGVALTLWVLALSFLLLPIGAVTVALLTREMAFGRIFLINISGVIVHNATSILLAWLGFGFISLAWGAVAGVVTAMIGSLIVRSATQPWLPGVRAWRRVFSAGSKLSGTSILYEIGLGGPELITGRMLGLEALAYYSRAFGAGTMALRALVDSLLPVAIPFFAQQARTGTDAASSYLRGLAYMSVLSFPLFFCLAVTAEPLIHLLYGSQWLQAARPMQILCIGFGFLAITNIAGAVLVGAGLLGTNLRMQAMFQPLKLVFAFVGSFAGLAGVAIGVATADTALSVYGIWRANQHLGVTLKETLRTLARSLGVAMGTALLTWLTLRYFETSESLLIQLSSAFIAAGLGWIGLIMLLKHPLRDEFSRAILPFSRRD